MRENQETCSSECPRPPEPPWRVRACSAVRTWITWPAQVREMKRLGFRHTGFMTWEAGPGDG